MINERRRILLLSCLGNALALTHTHASTGVTLLINESGVIDNPLEDRTFVTGVLSCNDVQSLEKSLNEIRIQLGYKLKLSYTSTDRWKLDFAKKALKVVLDSKAVRVHLHILSSEKNTGWPETKDTLASLYAAQQSTAVSQSLRPYDNPVEIKLERRSRGMRDDVLRNQLNYRYPTNVTIQFIKSYESNLSQVLDLITGTLFGIVEGRIKNSMKIELSDYFMSLIKADSNTLRTTNFKGEKIQITHIERV